MRIVSIALFVLLMLSTSACSVLFGFPRAEPAVSGPAVDLPAPVIPTQGEVVVTLLPKEPATQPLADEDLGQQLARAVESLDFAAMRALTGDQLAIATENQLLFLSPDETMERLRQSAFAEGAAPAVRWDSDTAALMGGIDPLGLWGPVVQPVQAMHVTGLGADASEEALLVIGRANDGSFYWLGIYLPEGGRFTAG